MAYEQYSACIEACTFCAEVCDSCMSAARNDPNHPVMTRCNSLCMDCAAICRMTAGFMSRDSEFIDLICQDCAEICEACMDESMKFDTEYCRDCAKACRKCMGECLKMGTMPFKPSSLMNGRSYNLNMH